MPSNINKALAVVLGLVGGVWPAHAQIVSDPGVSAGIQAQIATAGEQIKSMSQMVGAAKDQLATLSKVADGIRSLQTVVSGGVQGLLGDVADQLGLKDVFAVGKQLQTTFNDGMNLYRDLKSLPEDAKAQLRNIGVAVDDVEKYLSRGVYYDVFSGMGLDDWRKTFKNPIDALANGTVGRACIESDAYLDTEVLRQKYVEKLSNMSPEDRAAMGSYTGVNMALLNYGVWAKGMEKRLGKTVEFSVLADKAAEAAGGKGKAPTVVEATASLNGSVIASMKLGVEMNRQQAESDEIAAQQQTAQMLMMKEREDRGSWDERIKAVIAAQPR